MNKMAKETAVSPWTMEKEEKLLEIWSERRCLYDVSSKGYSNREFKTQALEECSLALEIPVSDIVKRMASLRTQYSRLLKPLPSGSAGKKKTPRQEWLLKNMEFLASHVKARPSVSNLWVETVEPVGESLQDDEGNDEGNHEATDTDRQETPTSNKQFGDCQPESKRRREDQKSKRCKLEEEELNVMRSLQKVLDEPPSEAEDDDTIFGKYLIREMQKITDEYAKVICVKSFKM